MFQISTAELKPTISILRKATRPFLLIGTYGIGKSEMIFQSAIEAAQASNRIFLDWNRSSKEEKEDAKRNPSKYHMFVDIRISQLDDGDLLGIPVIGGIDASNINELKLVTLGWINYITLPGAAGTVFFDEINLARPSVTASAYSIINDKVISDRAISPDVFIVAAGNKEEDCDLVQPIADPLLDRFAVAELKFDTNTWLEWAAKNINPYLYAFCKWKPDNIHRPRHQEKSVTPRGIYNASCILNQIDFEKENLVHRAIALCVGQAFATEFLAYYKYVTALNWDVLKTSPSDVSEYDTEKQYAVMGSAVAKIKLAANQENKNVGSFFEEICLPLTVISYLPSDFVMAIIKQFTSMYVTLDDKNKSKITLANILLKLMLQGPKSFKDASKFTKGQIEKMQDLEKLFKAKHVKIFSQI